MKRAIFLFFVLMQVSSWSFEPIREVEAYWNGEGFQDTADRQLLKKNSRVVQGMSIYFNAGHITCYGHALLDGVFPFYCMLKEYDLLNTPITLLVKADSPTQKNSTYKNIIQLLRDVFCVKDIIVLQTGDLVKRLVVNEHVPYGAEKVNCLSFYRTFPESFQYINYLKSLGFVDNVVFNDDKNTNNLLSEFVGLIKNRYGINCPVIKNRILIAYRSFVRKITNLDSLVSVLKNYGYDVIVVDFEKLSVQQQIIETAKSEYLLGTYGSNLVNAVFLQPQASVVVLWHKYAKYFWSRRYCIIHSAFLSVGTKLVEYDQPEYDVRNVYRESIHVPSYFYRSGNMNILYPDKVNMDAIINYPLPAMYEITNVDIFINPDDLVDCLKRSECL